MSSRRRISLSVSIAALASLPAPHAQGYQGRLYSALWGRDGERWDPKGRLPDFSYAGYRMGERTIPDFAVRGNVKAFGARGDGETDDTKAFQEAIRRTHSGAVFVPPGRYVITDFLEIDKSNLVLRGAGPDKTTLFFPKYLNDIKPNWGATTSGRRTSNYSWSGGFILIRSRFGRRQLAKVAERAERGSSIIVLDRRPGVRPGETIDIRQKDGEDNSLARYLYAGQSDDVSKLRGRTRTSFVSRVVGVQGHRLILERPLRTDVDPLWNAEVFEFKPTVTESGVEELTFEFPNVPYKGHFTELGHNPVAIHGAAHCWIRNIRVVNADSGPFVHARFCTLRGVVFESERKPDRSGCAGHHGITVFGDDNLVEGFDFKVRFIHDLTVTHCAGNVFRRGRGVDLSFDHHKKAAHANLFADIDLGEGGRMYKCGGGAALGRNCAAWGTFWNLRARRPQRPPPKRFGPDLMNFVGVESRDKAVMEPEGRWWEPVPPARLHPRDLYEAQLEARVRRLGGRSRSRAPKTAEGETKPSGRRRGPEPAPPKRPLRLRRPDRAAREAPSAQETSYDPAAKLHHEAETAFIHGEIGGETDGEIDKAKKLFETIIREHPESEYADRAKRYLNIIAAQRQDVQRMPDEAE